MLRKAGVVLCLLLGLLAGVYFLYPYLFKFSLTNSDENYRGYMNIEDCDTAIQDIVKKYRINKNRIEGCQTKEFQLDNRTIKFAHLEYGLAGDCPAGCAFSHYCAIIDGNKDYPYAFLFQNKQEDILGYNRGKGQSIQSMGEEDGYDLPGISHKLTTLPEFNQFLNDEIIHGGDIGSNSEFRWCG